MAYIGQRPVIGRYIKLDQISSGFNGSNTGFSMTAGSQAVFPGTARNLLLSLGGVIQEPDTDFTISGSTLTFTTPPVANTTFFGVIYGDMQATGTPSDGTVLPASIASSGNFSFPQVTVTSDLTISSASPKIFLTDTNNNDDFEIRNDDGTFTIRNSTDGNDIISVASDNATSFTGPITALSTSTFLGAAVFNENGGNVDFRVEGDSNTNLLFVDASADSVGIGLNNPNDTLHVFHATDNLVARFESGDTGGGITLKDNTHVTSLITTNGAFEINVDQGGDISGESIAFKLSGSSKVFIDSSGRLLIGDTSSASSTAMLQTKRANNNTILISNSDATATNFTAVDFAPANSTVGSRIVSKAIGTFGSSASQTADLFFETINEGTSEKRLYIDSTGKIGIGTDSPLNTLHIHGDGTLRISNSAGVNQFESGRLRFTENTSDFQGAYIHYDGNSNIFHIGTHHANDTVVGNDLNAISIPRGSGNVGIGTTSPDGTLDVRGTIFVNGDGTGGRIFASSGNLSLSDGNGRQVLRIDDPGTGNSHAHIFDSNGRLGISTTNPRSLLDLGTGTQNASITNDASFYQLGLHAAQSAGGDIGRNIGFIAATGGQVTAAISSVDEGGSDQTGLVFLTGNATSIDERVRIDQNGNVGIGTSAPGYALDVRKDSTTAYSASASPSNVIARLNNNSAQDDNHASFLLTAMNDNSAMDFWWMTIVSQSQNYNGFLAFTARTTSSSSQELVRFANNGNVTINGSLTQNASDIRLKTNIKIIPNSIEKIKKIRGITFDWVDDITSKYGFFPSAKHETGVIAQEIQEVIPDAVVTAPFNHSYTEKSGVNDNFLTVKQEKIIPLCIEAIKELSAKIETLNAKIETLEAEVAALKAA